MCVIAIVETSRPTTEQVAQMYAANPRGGGVAWRLNGRVSWEKGLTLEEMQEKNRDLPLPYVLHFRVPSHGTAQSLFGCHPFPIRDDASPMLFGQTDGFVLFHNGLWHRWKEELKDLAAKGGWKIPSGAWTDSRALALVANHMGLGMLELIDEKVVAFGPGEDDIEIFGSWQKCGEMLVSNTTWERTDPIVGVDRRLPAAYTTDLKKKDAETGGSPQAPTFRKEAGGAEHAAGSGDAEQESVQEADEDRKLANGEASEEAQEEAEAGSHGSLAESEFVTFGACTVCKHSKACIMEGGVQRCWQCWSAFKNHEAQGIRRWCNNCDECKDNYATARTFVDDKWVCRACWEKLGKPSVYYEFHSLEERRRELRRQWEDKGISRAVML